MGSHSVTYHPTQVNTPRLTPAIGLQADTRFTYPGGLTCVERCLTTFCLLTVSRLQLGKCSNSISLVLCHCVLCCQVNGRVLVMSYRECCWCVHCVRTEQRSALHRLSSIILALSLSSRQCWICVRLSMTQQQRRHSSLYSHREWSVFSCCYYGNNDVINIFLLVHKFVT